MHLGIFLYSTLKTTHLRSNVNSDQDIIVNVHQFFFFFLVRSLICYSVCIPKLCCLLFNNQPEINLLQNTKTKQHEFR